MIDGVTITKRKQIKDERGMVAHMLRCDEKIFKTFGEIYFSYVKPGVVKGWHLHKKMTLNYVVPFGKIKLVLYDDRKNSKTRGNFMELIVSPDSYNLITVPPGIWNGFMGLGKTMSIVANCATIPYNPKEIKRIDPHKNTVIEYDWNKTEDENFNSVR